MGARVIESQTLHHHITSALLTLSQTSKHCAFDSIHTQLDLHCHPTFIVKHAFASALCVCPPAHAPAQKAHRKQFSSAQQFYEKLLHQLWVQYSIVRVSARICAYKSRRKRECQVELDAQRARRTAWRARKACRCRSARMRTVHTHTYSSAACAQAPHPPSLLRRGVLVTVLAVIL